MGQVTPRPQPGAENGSEAVLSTREMSVVYSRLASLLRAHALIAGCLAVARGDCEGGHWELERQAKELETMAALLWDAKAVIDLRAL